MTMTIGATMMGKIVQTASARATAIAMASEAPRTAVPATAMERVQRTFMRRARSREAIMAGGPSLAHQCLRSYYLTIASRHRRGTAGAGPKLPACGADNHTLLLVI